MKPYNCIHLLGTTVRLVAWSLPTTASSGPLPGTPWGTSSAPDPTTTPGEWVGLCASGGRGWGSVPQVRWVGLCTSGLNLALVGGNPVEKSSVILSSISITLCFQSAVSENFCQGLKKNAASRIRSREHAFCTQEFSTL